MYWAPANMYEGNCIYVRNQNVLRDKTSNDILRPSGKILTKHRQRSAQV